MGVYKLKVFIRCIICCWIWAFTIARRGAVGAPPPRAHPNRAPARYEETQVDEGVRWATPVLHFRRQCTQDYELNGVQMKAGDKVVLWHIAANRDPRAFDDPWNFDIERTPNDHVGIGGGGPHLG